VPTNVKGEEFQVTSSAAVTFVAREGEGQGKVATIKKAKTTTTGGGRGDRLAREE